MSAACASGRNEHYSPGSSCRPSRSAAAAATSTAWRTSAGPTCPTAAWSGAATGPGSRAYAHIERVSGLARLTHATHTIRWNAVVQQKRTAKSRTRQSSSSVSDQPDHLATIHCDKSETGGAFIGCRCRSCYQRVTAVSADCCSGAHADDFLTRAAKRSRGNEGYRRSRARKRRADSSTCKDGSSSSGAPGAGEPSERPGSS